MIFFFEKLNKTVKSTFRLFNLCNGEKNCQNIWGGECEKKRVCYSAFGPVFYFVWLRPRILRVHRRPIETNGPTINLGLWCFWETQPCLFACFMELKQAADFNLEALSSSLFSSRLVDTIRINPESTLSSVLPVWDVHITALGRLQLFLTWFIVCWSLIERLYRSG